MPSHGIDTFKIKVELPVKSLWKIIWLPSNCYWDGWVNGIIDDRKLKLHKSVCLTWALYHFREAVHICYYAQHHLLRNFRTGNELVFFLYLKIFLYILPCGLISNKMERK